MSLCAHLDEAVLLARGHAAHVAGIAAARAALHLHARRPDQEVGSAGVHLAPRDLVDDGPRPARRWHCLLCRRERARKQWLRWFSEWAH